MENIQLSTVCNPLGYNQANTGCSSFFTTCLCPMPWQVFPSLCAPIAAWSAASIGLSVLPMSLLCVKDDGMQRTPWENRGGCCWSHGFPRLREGSWACAWPALLTELHIMLILQASPCCTRRDSLHRPHGRGLPDIWLSIILYSPLRNGCYI